MSFQRPTLPDLVTRIQADFVSRLTLAGAILRKAVIYVTAQVLAGAAHMMHGHLEFLSEQLFPDKSTDEFLVRQAAIFNLSKNAPTFSKGTITITGTNGTVIPINTLLRSPAGFEYKTDAQVTIALGTATAAVTSLLAGANTRLVAGLVLTFESPIVGANSTAPVATVTQDGDDLESTEGLRARLLARMADPVHGGSVADYIEWAKEVAGVTRVWVTPFELGAGTVVVRFARDGDAGPIPDSGEVAAVQTKIDALKPAHAAVTVVAPVADVIAFTIHIVPDTAALRTAVTAELDDIIKTDGSPGGTINLSRMRTAIGATPGITDYTLTTPVANRVSPAGQLPTLGVITWT